MHFAFNDDQRELRRSARAFLEAASPPTRVRSAMVTDAGYEEDVWRRIGGELGWTSLTIPEEYGGAGVGQVELVAVLEETGRALLCAPLFSTVCLGVNALLVAGNADQKAEHLPGIAAGETRATLAHAEPGGRWDAAGIEATARRDGGDYLLSGKKSFVVDGHTADLLVVAARSPGSRGDEGISLFLVPASAPGLSRRRLPTMDQTRRLAEITLDGVRVPASARLGGEGEGGRALEKTLDLAAVALAAEQVGGAERCLELSVEYAKVRVQFGRPIGSFQAIKHKLADMLVDVESARSAAYYAGWVASNQEADLPAAASLAKATCSDGYFRCASETIQIHGGIGFTWEHDAHLYFKRARSSESLFGDATYHRDVYARRTGI